MHKTTNPFAWAAAALAAALQRSRASMAANSLSAERARFDTRKWTPTLLKHLEWRRLEELCAAYFDAAGFDTRTAVVHCKPWDAYRVGIKSLRDLRAAMTAAEIDKGVLVTSGRFTQEAVAFAAKESIQLIDGAALLERLEALGTEKSLALLKLTTHGDFLTPTCPGCAIKMTSRRSTQGGRSYWGCTNYPRCKQTLPTAVFAF